MDIARLLPNVCGEVAERRKAAVWLSLFAPYLPSRLLLRVNPEIARALKEEEREVMRDLKSSLGKDVMVKPDLLLHHEQFDVMAV